MHLVIVKYFTTHLSLHEETLVFERNKGLKIEYIISELKLGTNDLIGIICARIRIQRIPGEDRVRINMYFSVFMFHEFFRVNLSD